MSAELERTIERVWTLAGCVAELRWAAGRPITQEELIAELLDVKSPGITWGFARPRRADLARFRDDLPEIAETLEQQHRILATELARPAKLEQRPEARVANVGPPACRIELDVDRIRALGTEDW